jgi:hypothetical protein
MDKKLGVIVPYRNRKSHLKTFKKNITDYLNKKNIPFELIIVEQVDRNPFNRGKLLNIGVIEAERLECDYVVLHDVDMLPVDVDYSYSADVLQLANKFISDGDYTKEIYDGYFGGVTLFPIEVFKNINGYPNDFWGWGFEDDELLRRCIINGIETDSQTIKNSSTNKTALEFNGIKSYIKVSNIIDYTKNIKISVSFRIQPDIDYKKPYGEWTIFSIPGYDMTLTAIDLFGTYKFELWDFKKNVYSIITKQLPIHSTNITIEINPEECLVTLYQNEEVVTSFNYYKKLFKYSKEEWIYLGNANPYRGSNFKEFYGYISEFKVYNDGKEIINLDIKNYEYGKVKTNTNLDEAEVFSCDLIKIDESNYEYIQIPKKRVCIFKLMKHVNNGFQNGKWKDINTRINQIQYNKKINITGLSDLKYTIIDRLDNRILVKL